MTSVDLSSNRFEGDIPNSIGSLSSLVLLNLSHNSFHGHIPAEIAKLQALKALDFSWNRLIGEIPGLLSCLTVFEECGNNNVSDESPLEQDDDDDSFFVSGFTWEAMVIRSLVDLIRTDLVE
ncbi:probable inactive receptor kinase At5g67200 [Solanum tuberosum]|uniref:probable inactive receptor kinase At5g67200 n=1 Tax=Solanum tuberosum TaxID=4113 RepID=UPI00073A32B4|nr:PREDICTED: probable inactive receptor kinase At5g67200 [Solanum tuberosum]